MSDWPHHDAPWHDTAQVCLRGHLINGRMQETPDWNSDYCKDCGAKTISACPTCKTEIQGQYHNTRYLLSAMTTAPAYCHGCGSAYPWQGAAIDAAKALAEELELNDADQVDLKAAIDGLAVESSMTSVAAVRFKKLILKAKGPAIQMFKDAVSKIAVESAKQWLG